MLRYAQATDRGRVRPDNEDATTAHTAAGAALFAVADGLGGMMHGEVASRSAVDTLSRWFTALKTEPTTGELAAAFEEANAAIWRLNRAQPVDDWMATTLTACVFVPGRLFTAHVGDSRLYLCRGDRIRQMTVDHSAGRHELTRVVGMQAGARPDLAEHAWEPGDVYVLCTDGLYSMVSEARLLRAACAYPPEEACRRLLSEGNAAGGFDNLTLQIVMLK